MDLPDQIELFLDLSKNLFIYAGLLIHVEKGPVYIAGKPPDEFFR